MSDFKYRQHQNDDHHDHDGHDGNDNDDHGHTIHDQQELTHYVHDMLRALEAITAGCALMPLSRSIGEARKVAASLLIAG